MEAYITALHGI